MDFKVMKIESNVKLVWLNNIKKYKLNEFKLKIWLKSQQDFVRFKPLIIMHCVKLDGDSLDTMTFIEQ